MNRQAVSSKIIEIGIIPCARVHEAEHARFAAETLSAAGIPIIEIPLTLKEAPAVIRDLAARYPHLVVGAGTVLDAESAKAAIDAGSRFITSPGFVPEVVECACKAETTVFPGACTPTEVIAAWKAGSDFVKIFPASTVGGTHFIQALKVPLSHIPLVVTGGVNQLTAFDYILAGASAIGVGGELVPGDALVRRQGDRIHELARRFLKMVREARAQLASN